MFAPVKFIGTLNNRKLSLLTISQVTTMFSRFSFRFQRKSRFNLRSITSGHQTSKKSEAPLRISVLTQEGPTIYELPSIIQKIRDISFLSLIQDNPKDNRKKNRKIGKGKLQIHIETTEGTAILFGPEPDLFENLENGEKIESGNGKSASGGIGPVVESMITEEINCRLALEALKEIMLLESSETYRRTRRSKISKIDGRERVLCQLIEMIGKTRETEMIIEGLALLQRNKISAVKNPHRDLLADEILIRATNGFVNLEQLVKSVTILSSYEDPSYRETVDALWIGIKIREQEINEENLVSLFKILPRFETSREIVKTILEKKLTIKWWKLTGNQMAEILKIFHDECYNSMIASSCARKWATLHMNTEAESELFNFMNIFSKVKSKEAPIEKALEKYMGRKGLKIEDPSVVALTMNYCMKIRLRNPRILGICEEYLIKHAMELPASLLAPLFVPFGYLNYRPSNAENFWKIFESALASKFSNLEIHDTLNILLSMIYLERTPINFVDKVFTPKFIEKLHSKEDNATIEARRKKLRLLDAAMSVECDRYTCRMIPQDKSEKNVTMRARIKRVTKLIYRSLASIVGDEKKIGKSVILGRLPIIDLYTLDLLVYSSPTNQPIFRLDRTSQKEIGTALLIHLPEHYCHDESHLIGSQQMRIRHLNKLGFRVTTLNYKKILGFASRKDEMINYLTERLGQSQNV